MKNQDFEKLGLFYLGKEYDLEQRKVGPELVLYDSKQLTTHAVCVGMTGSGKTGLCLSLLEEAAIDGIPVIAIDPKGDLGNLLLSFPELRGEDFAPWVDPDEATRKGLTREQFADQTAKLWQEGLAAWGQDGARIKRFRDSADLAIYTPGSSRRAAADGPSLVRGPAAGPDRPGRGLPRAGRLLGLGAAGAPGDRGRPDLQPRAHPAGQRARPRLAGGPRPRHGGLHPRRAVAAVRQGRRDRPGDLLPRQGAVRPGDEAEQPDRLARVRRLDGGRVARRRQPALHHGGQAAAVDPLDRPPVGRRADVLRHDPPERGAGLDPDPAGDLEPARRALHGRDLRLFPPHGQPAVEDADAHPAQAGAGLRPGGRAGHAEPGRPRLQGAVERRDLVPGPVADQARQGAGARGAGRGLERGRAELRSPEDGRDPLQPGQPRLPDEQRARGPAGRLPDPLGALVPSRSAHPRADPDADGAAEAGAGRPGHAQRRPRGRRPPARDGRHRRRQPRASLRPVRSSARRPGAGPWCRRTCPSSSSPAGTRSTPGAALLYRPALLGVARLHYADKKAGIDHWETLGLLRPVGEELPADVWDGAEVARRPRPRAGQDRPSPAHASPPCPPRCPGPSAMPSGPRP